eukprot:s2789_g8.t1
MLGYPPSLDSGLHQQISSRLLSGSKDEPVSPEELRAFLEDLRAFLHVDSDDASASIAWRCSVRSRSGYFHVLRAGVPLGVGLVIPQCSVMHPPAPPDAVRLPLQHCQSAWKSALDHADIVDDLLASEFEAGWICKVSGGDGELKRRFAHAAVGKRAWSWQLAVRRGLWLTPPSRE